MAKNITFVFLVASSVFLFSLIYPQESGLLNIICSIPIDVLLMFLSVGVIFAIFSKMHLPAKLISAFIILIPINIVLHNLPAPL
jgi:hypothetical protein